MHPSLLYWIDYFPNSIGTFQLKWKLFNFNLKVSNFSKSTWYYRCCWCTLKMVCVGDNLEMLMTDLRCFDLFCIRKSSKSWFCHRHLKSVTIIQSSTWPCHQHYCHHQLKTDCWHKISVKICPKNCPFYTWHDGLVRCILYSAEKFLFVIKGHS